MLCFAVCLIMHHSGSAYDTGSCTIISLLQAVVQQVLVAVKVLASA